MDLVRLTHDITVLAWRLLRHRLIWKQHDQLCCYCQGADNGRCPRPLPPKLNRYRNVWLILPWMPCTRRSKIQKPDGSGIREMHVCNNEGGYIHLSLWILPFALFLHGLWLWALIWVIFKIT